MKLTGRNGRSLWQRFQLSGNHVACLDSSYLEWEPNLSVLSSQFHMRETDRENWVDNQTGQRMSRGEQA